MDKLTIPQLRDLFTTLNAQYFSGRLPTCRIRAKRRGRFLLHGEYNRGTRTITIDMRQPAPKIRETLLHEMCHLETRGVPDDDPRFLAALGRLAAMGETWAAEQQAMYSDPMRPTPITRREARSTLEDLLRATRDPAKESWATMRLHLSGQLCLTVRDLYRLWPQGRAVFYRLRAQEIKLRQNLTPLPDSVWESHALKKARQR